MHECKTDKSCGTEHAEGCTCHQHQCHQHEEPCSMAEHMLHLVKCAKHDLLKEKMKKVLEAKIGKKLDKVAEIAVDTAIELMQSKTYQLLK